MIIVKLLGSASGIPQGCEGQYLQSYDLEAYDGQGDVEFTADPAKALRFADVVAFHAVYAASPKCRPTRADGKPNRPLTASHWELESA